jgi:hypothetical protein
VNVDAEVKRNTREPEREAQAAKQQLDATTKKLDLLIRLLRDKNVLEPIDLTRLR